MKMNEIVIIGAQGRATVIVLDAQKNLLDQCPLKEYAGSRFEARWSKAAADLKGRQ